MRFLFDKYNILIVLVVALFFFWINERMRAMDFVSLYDFQSRFGLLCGIVLGIVALLYNLYGMFTIKHETSSEILSFIFFLFYITAYSVLHHLWSPVENVQAMFLSVMPPVLCLMAFYMMLRIEKEELFAFAICLVIMGLFINMRDSLSRVGSIFDNVAYAGSSSYFLLYLLPFTLCVKKNIIRYAAFMLIFFTMIMTTKRGGLLAFVLGVLVYFYVKQKISQKQLGSGFGYVIFAVLALSFVYILTSILESNNTEVLNKMAGMGSDEGSGRLRIYSDVVGFIYNSDMFQFLFGHGYGGVSIVNKEGLSAHNDYLEVLYDYGLLGLLLLIKFLVSMLCFTKKLVQEKSYLAAPMAVSLTLFIVNSMVSHIVIYFAFLSIFGMFWGFVIGIYYRERFLEERISQILNANNA